MQWPMLQQCCCIQTVVLCELRKQTVNCCVDASDILYVTLPLPLVEMRTTRTEDSGTVQVTPTMSWSLLAPGRGCASRQSTQPLTRRLPVGIVRQLALAMVAACPQVVAQPRWIRSQSCVPLLESRLAEYVGKAPCSRSASCLQRLATTAVVVLLAMGGAPPPDIAKSTR